MLHVGRKLFQSSEDGDREGHVQADHGQRGRDRGCTAKSDQFQSICEVFLMTQQ